MHQHAHTHTHTLMHINPPNHTFHTKLDICFKPTTLRNLHFQGVKFDPEGNQHMRLEFARTNTKVTKPKFVGPNSFPGTLGVAVNAHHVQTGLTQHTGMTGCPGGLVAGGLPSIMAGLQPSLFSQLVSAGGAAGCK